MGVELLLVGEIQRNCLTYSLSRLRLAIVWKMLRSGDVVVHLAVLNNVRKTSEQESISVNRDLAVFVAKKVVAAGIAKFIYISSCHALNWKKITQYARSKREGEEALKKIHNLQLLIIYLPKVMDKAFQKKSLVALNEANHFVSRFPMFSLSHIKMALSPFVTAQTVCSRPMD